ncbi:cation:dicarboxylase symporter family transporter [Vibrio chagasii]|nr:cation:dicarboxylase symporter family transporter [Vibrio chagasii]
MLVNSFQPTHCRPDGPRSTSIIAVVIFTGVLTGIAARKVMAEELESPIRTFVEAAQSIVMRLVKMIMALTPEKCKR